MENEAIVKVTRNTQITIPAKIRQKFHIKQGDLVKVIYDEDQNMLIIAKAEEEPEEY